MARRAKATATCLPPGPSRLKSSLCSDIRVGDESNLTQSLAIGRDLLSTTERTFEPLLLPVGAPLLVLVPCFDRRPYSSRIVKTPFALEYPR